MRHLIFAIFLILAGNAAGADFEPVKIETTGDINQVYFLNDQLGWMATSDGEVLGTFDGGKTWQKREVTSREIKDIHFLARTGYIVGERGLVMKSTNGGATWEDISQNIKYDFTGVGMVNDSVIIICGTDQNSMSKTKGEVFQSFDFGKTWKKHDWKLGNGFVDLAVCPPRKVYLLAIKKVAHSISQGVRYFHGGYEGDRMGFGFDFMDDWGFMVGHDGLFAKTITHGRLWDEIPTDTSAELYAIEMYDKTSGVAVGEKGLVMHFYDDGERRVFENVGTDKDLLSVFVTGQKIFIGGEDGLFMAKERFPRAKNLPQED